MMAVSLLSIALKLVAARRGELVCYMETKSGTLQSDSYLEITNALPYIVASDGCIKEVYRLSGGKRRQNLPFMMFLMTLCILAIDILSFRIRKFEQRILRFHQMIIKRGVLTSGDHHQDVDDILHPMETPIFKEAIKAMAKDRSRNELCNELKRSNILFFTFIVKNVTKVVIITVYLFFEGFIQNFQLRTSPIGTCDHTHSDAILEHQMVTCQEKFSSMFSIFIVIYGLLLVLYGICSMGCLMFVVTSRPVTAFMSRVNKLLRCGKKRKLISRKRVTVVEKEEGVKDDVVLSMGHDFFFLFDLLAHNYGLELALKSMTYVDKDFYNLMSPMVTVKNIDIGCNDMTVEWTPSQMETLLEEHESKFRLCSLRECKRSRIIKIDGYRVTVIQMDQKNQSILDIINVRLMDVRVYDNVTGKYRLKFDRLSGGENKYSITVSVVMGETMMKGRSVLRYLRPQDPGLSLDGKLCTKVTSNAAELKWIAPYGGFDRYILTAESDDGLIRKMINKKETYTLHGLQPCTRYNIDVHSVNGIKDEEEIYCTNPIQAVLLTTPNKPDYMFVSNVTEVSCTLHWNQICPQKWVKEKMIPNSCNMKFKIDVKDLDENLEKKDSKGNKIPDETSKIFIKLEVGVHTCTTVCKKKGCMYTHKICGLKPRNNYDVSLRMLCSAPEVGKDWMESDAASAQFSTTFH